MSTEQKPDHEQETLKNTSDPWLKNAEEHHRLELQITLLAGRLDSVSDRLASVEGKLDKLSEESAKRDEKTRADFKEAMKEIKADFKQEMKELDDKRVEEGSKLAKELEKLDDKRIEEGSKLAKKSKKRDKKTRANFKEAMKEIKAEFKEEMEKMDKRRIEDNAIFAKELEKIEDRAETRRKEDQSRSRWFAGFLILLATAMIGVVSNFSAIVSFFTTLQ